MGNVPRALYTWQPKEGSIIMAVRYTTDGGGFSDPANPQTRESAPVQSSQESSRTGGAASAYRIQVIPDDVKPETVTKEPSGPGTAVNRAGSPVSLANLRADDSIVDPELGRMRVEVLVHMGKMRPAHGGGFEFVSDSQPKGAPADTKQEAGDETDEGKAEAAEDAANERVTLDRASEMLITDVMQKAGEGPVLALSAAITSNQHIAIGRMLPEIAQAMGVERDEAQAQLAHIQQAWAGHAQRIAAEVGIGAAEYADAAEHLVRTNPTAVSKANMALFQDGDPRPARKLFADYADSPTRYDEASLEGATMGDGMTVFREDGKFFVQRDGDRMRLSEAIRLKIVKVSKKS